MLLGRLLVLENIQHAAIRLNHPLQIKQRFLARLESLKRLLCIYGDGLHIN